MSEFFHMGGYGAFVWPAYLLSVIVLCIMTVATSRAYQKHKRLLRQLEDGAPSRGGS